MDSIDFYNCSEMFFSLIEKWSRERVSPRDLKPT